MDSTKKETVEAGDQGSHDLERASAGADDASQCPPSTEEESRYHNRPGSTGNQEPSPLMKKKDKLHVMQWVSKNVFDSKTKIKDKTYILSFAQFKMLSMGEKRMALQRLREAEQASREACERTVAKFLAMCETGKKQDKSKVGIQTDQGEREGQSVNGKRRTEKNTNRKRKGERKGAQKGESGKVGAQKGESGKVGAQKGESGNVGAQKGESGKVGAEKGESGKVNAQKGESGKVGVQKGESGKVGAQKGESGKVGAQKGESSKVGAQKGESGKVGAQKGESGKVGAQKGESGKVGAEKGESGKVGA